MAAWRLQGLPQTYDPRLLNGYDPTFSLGLDVGPLPRFDEVVIEEDERRKVWIDPLGVKRLDFKNQVTPGFVTRRYLKFPVSDRDEWERMRKRFDPESVERYPLNWLESVNGWAEKKEDPFLLTIPSMFWAVRDWVGLEGLCCMFYDDPGLVSEMMGFVVDFDIALLKKLFQVAAPDYVFLNEDMAYKTASMISIDMVRKFMMPGYRKLVDFLRRSGVAFVVMDCDGHMSELIPIWLEAGMNAVSPIEIAAGNDPIAYRKEYGKDLAMLGGIDKRELRFGKDRVKAEVCSKVPWLIEQGGFIPGVDHGVPPDVPLRNFIYMGELIKAIAVGQDPEDVPLVSEFEKSLGPIQKLWDWHDAYGDED